MSEILEVLEREYCPPIDAALFHAIVSDYSLDEIHLARKTLDGLKRNAVEEQLTDFDPSGSSGPGVSDDTRAGPLVCSEGNIDKSTVTDTTYISQALSFASMSPVASGSSTDDSYEASREFFKERDGCDNATNELLLREMFQSLRPQLISFTLKKVDGNYERAVDELLNKVYLEDSSSPDEGSPLPKGIDGFFADEEIGRPKKGKGKGKRKNRQNQASEETTNETKLVPHYAPVSLRDEVESAPKTPILAPTARPHTVESLFEGRNAAFTQAHEVYRRGRSNPLMRAAAGYYAQIGHDLNANLHTMTADEADALVQEQSTPTQLDLHGVSVEHAKRIAKAKVNAWWEGLGEERIPGGGRRGAGEGFSIITGVGRHSADGKAKIGPAVAKALMVEGWKVNLQSGSLVVEGKARKK